MVDPAVVRRRLRKLEEVLARLHEVAEAAPDSFREDPTLQAAAERHLQVAIQVVLDVGAHILSERGIVDWDRYRQIPQRLAGEDVIPPELAERLERAAGQRNVLVHLYLDVDPGEIYRTLQADLDAFSEFAGHVTRLLDEEAEADEPRPP